MVEVELVEFEVGVRRRSFVEGREDGIWYCVWAISGDGAGISLGGGRQYLSEHLRHGAVGPKGSGLELSLSRGATSDYSE